MHEIRFGQRLRRLVQKRPASQILLFVTPLTHTHHSTGYVMTAANYQAATTGAGQSLSQTERFNSERTDCGPVSQSKRRLVAPGSNATPYQLRFYENEYQYRSVLVRREACDADPALLGTKATITRRASSGRGRSLAA